MDRNRSNTNRYGSTKRPFKMQTTINPLIPLITPVPKPQSISLSPPQQLPILQHPLRRRGPTYDHAASHKNTSPLPLHPRHSPDRFCNNPKGGAKSKAPQNTLHGYPLKKPAPVAVSCIDFLLEIYILTNTIQQAVSTHHVICVALPTWHPSSSLTIPINDARLTLFASFKILVVAHDSPSPHARNTPLPSQRGPKKMPYMFGMFTPPQPDARPQSLR